LQTIPNTTRQGYLRKEPMMLSIQGENLFAQMFKKSKLSLPEKFDGSHLKFQEFIIEIQQIIFLQLQCYSTNKLQVSIIGTLLTRQVLFWFVSIWNGSNFLNNHFSLANR